jgi:hypothetical protein
MIGLVVSLSLALLMQDGAPAAAAPPPDPMGKYLADLEKAGILTADKEPASLERLKSQLAEAEDDLVTGNAQVASVKLFRLVESPQYAKFDYAPGGRQQDRRAIPAARDGARDEVAGVRARLPGNGRHRAGDA